MTADELTAVIDGTSIALRLYIDSKLDGFVKRLDVLEQRGLEGMETTKALRSDLETVGKDVATWQRTPGPSGPPGPPGEAGKDAEPVDLDALVLRVAELIPTPKDGRDGLDGAIGPQGEPGKDAEPVDLEVLALRAAELIPRPKDGERGEIGPPGVPGERGADGISVTLDDVAPLVQQEVAKAFEAVPVPKDGKDGTSVAGALVDSNGELVLTFSDGVVKSLGSVVGPAGRDGRDGFPGVPGRPGEPGKDGADGLDGLGFDDLQGVLDERGFVLRFVKDTRSKEFVLPIPMYRGVFKDGETYGVGQVVTWAGHMWIAKEATAIKPDETGAGARAWVLCVRRGRDGKQGPEGKQGPPGLRGEKGERGPDRW